FGENRVVLAPASSRAFRGSRSSASSTPSVDRTATRIPSNLLLFTVCLRVCLPFSRISHAGWIGETLYLKGAAARVFNVLAGPILPMLVRIPRASAGRLSIHENPATSASNSACAGPPPNSSSLSQVSAHTDTPVGGCDARYPI